MINPQYSWRFFEDLYNHETSSVDIFKTEFGIYFKKDFKKKYKYANLDKKSLFNLLCYEITKQDGMSEKKEYIKAIFYNFTISNKATFEETITFTYILKEYYKDEEYLTNVINYLFFIASNSMDYISLFHLYRITIKDNVNTELQKTILNKARIKANSSYELLCLSVSYKVLGDSEKANKYALKGFETFRKDDIYEVSQTIKKIKVFFENDKEIKFNKWGWFYDFSEQLYKIKSHHKDFNKFQKKKGALQKSLKDINYVEKKKRDKLKLFKINSKNLFNSLYYHLSNDFNGKDNRLNLYGLELDNFNFQLDSFDLIFKHIKSCPYCKKDMFHISHSYTPENCQKISIFLNCSSCKEIITTQDIKFLSIINHTYEYSKKIKNYIDQYMEDIQIAII